MKLFCSYYLATLSAVSLPFFAILWLLEYHGSEYMRLHFRQGRGDDKSRTLTIAMAMILNLIILVGLIGYIRKLKAI